MRRDHGLGVLDGVLDILSGGDDALSRGGRLMGKRVGGRLDGVVVLDGVVREPLDEGVRDRA
jgi:hypothetical protein